MQQRLCDLAVSARCFIEPFWDKWHAARGSDKPDVASRHTCGRTSLFLVKALGHEGIAARWVSGVPRLTEHGPDVGPYGFFAGSRWESHAWAHCGAWIIDITADQFGADPVIVTPFDDQRYRAGGRDTALPAYVEARHRAVEDAWPDWLTYRREELAARR